VKGRKYNADTRSDARCAADSIPQNRNHFAIVFPLFIIYIERMCYVRRYLRYFIANKPDFRFQVSLGLKLPD